MQPVIHLAGPEEVEVLVCLDVEDGGLGAGAIGRLEPGHIYMVEAQRSFQKMAKHVPSFLRKVITTMARPSVK